MVISTKKVQKVLSKFILSAMIFALVVVQPTNIVLATEDGSTETITTDQATTQTPSTPPESEVGTNPVTPTTGPQTPPGPTQPNGVDSQTYVQNTDTGNWENEQYIWDPITHQTRPKQKPDYYYDPVTSTWSTTEWTFDPASGKYVATPKPVAPSLLEQLGLLAGGGRTNINGTGQGSNNQINANDSANGIFNLYTKAEINNYFNIYSISGNSLVSNNTEGGDAISGDTNVLTNILNLLASAWNISGGQMLTFIQSLYGDVNGDILLDTGNSNYDSDKSLGGSKYGINGTGPNSNNTISDNKDGNLMINTSNYNDINNNVVIDAQSGDATVGCSQNDGGTGGGTERMAKSCTGNTKAGSAKSGDARVLVNLMNLIDSYISSGKSFFGVINIYGNLNGDILFSKDFLNQLLASGELQHTSGNLATINNTGPNSNNTIDTNRSGNSISNTNDLSTINNNIVADAKSGDANVLNNTSAGDAKTGKSDIRLTLLNLTGHQVIAKNAVLVFVNVFGSWLGLIMDAPQGATSALIGGDVDKNTQQQSGSSINNSNSVNTINNNLNLNASSGDANVGNNTEAGDAQSGDADIALNVGNIINSNFSISDWFGVLFINVFGNWIGSFGVDTPAGNIYNKQSLSDSSMGDEAQQFATSQNLDNLLKLGSQLNISSSNGANSTSSQNILASISPNNSVTNQLDYKRPDGRPFSDYAFPLFAIIAVSVAGVIFQLSKKYSK